MANIYFLTWHTYGTWLHGDPRGSVDSEHNQPNAPLAPGDSNRAGPMQAMLKRAPLMLDDPARALVEATIRRHCEIRAWRLWAVSVRTNHVHVVVGCPVDVPPERAMEQFKAWATRRLRENGMLGVDDPAWVEHGSTRWLKTEASLAEVLDYVENRQGPG